MSDTSYNKKRRRQPVDNSTLPLQDQLEKGYNYSLWMLGRSQKTEKEVRRKLREKKYDQQVIDAIIERLYEYKFLDDEMYAQLYAEDAYNFNGLGRRGIQQKMYAKGFESAVIEEALNQIFDDNKEDERERVKEIALSRVRGMRNLEPSKAYNRLCGYLSRKGFSGDLVYQVARETVDEFFGENDDI